MSELCVHQLFQGLQSYSDSYATTFSTLFSRQAVGCTKVGTPVASSDGENGEFGNDDGGADSSCDFF